MSLLFLELPVLIWMFLNNSLLHSTAFLEISLKIKSYHTQGIRTLLNQNKYTQSCWILIFFCPLVFQNTLFFCPCLLTLYHMSPVTRKPVFGVSDQVRLKPACSAKDVSWSLEILDNGTRDIILSTQWTKRCWSDCVEAQADLRLCCSHMDKTGFLMTWLIYMVRNIELGVPIFITQTYHIHHKYSWKQYYT